MLCRVFEHFAATTRISSILKCCSELDSLVQEKPKVVVEFPLCISKVEKSRVKYNKVQEAHLWCNI